MCDQAVHSLAQDEKIKEIINKFMGGYIYWLLEMDLLPIVLPRVL